MALRALFAGEPFRDLKSRETLQIGPYMYFEDKLKPLL